MSQDACYYIILLIIIIIHLHYFYGLVNVILSSWGNETSVFMVVAFDVHLWKNGMARGR